MEKRYHYITPNDYVTAEENGISEHALYQRVHIYGWDIDRAISQPMRSKGVPFEHVWSKWKETAEENGISKDVFYSRCRNSGWAPEKAATIPVGELYSGKWTAEELEIARRNGIDGNSMSLVSIRIKKLGWSKEKALNTPKVSEKERAKRVAEGTRKYHRERGVNREFNKTV